MPVRHGSHLSVAKVQADQEVLLVEIVLRTVRRHLGAIAPEFRQIEPQVQLNQPPVPI